MPRQRAQATLRRKHATPLLLVPLGLLVLAPAACRRSRPRLERGDAAVVLVKASAPVPEGMPVVAEQEPNSEAAPPMPLRLEAGGSLAVHGTLGLGGGADQDGEDVYTIELAGAPAAPVAAAPGSDAAADAAVVASHQLTVEVTPDAPLATAVVLRDPGGRTLGTSAGAPGARHGLPNVAVAATTGGRYTLSVRRAGKPAPGAAAPVAYLLVLKTAPLGAADEREPNDDPAAANPVGPAHSEPQVAGFLGGKGDQDFYRVPVGETGEASVIHVELELPPEAAASLTVLDGQARKLASARSRKGERLVLRNLAREALAPAQAGGLFLVVVRSDGAGDLERRYVLGIRSESAPDREREPDDDPAQARTIGSALTGHLTAGDVDVFKVTAPAGGDQQVEVTPPQRLDVVLEVMPAGATRWTRVDKAGRGQPERALIPGGVAVPVRVSAKRATDGEPDEPYTLLVTPAAAAPAGPPP
jgi:hypothetical protein